MWRLAWYLLTVKWIENLDDWDSNDQMIVISGTTADLRIDNYPDIPLQKYDSWAQL